MQLDALTEPFVIPNLNTHAVDTVFLLPFTSIYHIMSSVLSASRLNMAESGETNRMIRTAPHGSVSNRFKNKTKMNLPFTDYNEETDHNFNSEPDNYMAIFSHLIEQASQVPGSASYHDPKSQCAQFIKNTGAQAVKDFIWDCIDAGI